MESLPPRPLLIRPELPAAERAAGAAAGSLGPGPLRGVRPWRDRLGVLGAALWWGSLTAVGAWVVPMLFAFLPTPSQAGGMAARLFAAQTWVALGCGVLLLMLLRGRLGEPRGSGPAGVALAFVLGGMLAALLLEFAVAPRIVARQDLRLWHSVGSVLYGLQWLCAGVTLWKLAGEGPGEGEGEGEGEGAVAPAPPG